MGFRENFGYNASDYNRLKSCMLSPELNIDLQYTVKIHRKEYFSTYLWSMLLTKIARLTNKIIILTTK